MNVDPFVTQDGSSTLYSKRYNQYYHNPNGALSESQTVFIERLNIAAHLKAQNGELKIFEMGFGTGLNFLLAAQAFLTSYPNLMDKDAAALHFYSVEANPISTEIAATFHYPIDWQKGTMTEWISSSLNGLNKGWNHYQPEEDLPVFLHLYWGNIQDITELSPLNQGINFYFHDPFSIQQNPECWEPSIFERYKKWGCSQAKLSTYAAATQVRAAMAVAGWQVYKAMGALGKREMTIASLEELPNAVLQDQQLKACDHQRLTERWNAGEWM
jgi:tRNA U34 5-methylaminomethyl-2-thiouridine-forming methyltransferase MnmC